ncbi:MAG: hypothetical protein Q7S78_01330 [Candidatus Azambacteria bacterium]|nr:hypothetical protein [Candidatus Azambacteria bacterium]
MKYPKVSQYLSRCIDKDFLSHAYVFYGPDDFKNEIALWFANKLLKNESSKFHPDLFSIESDSNEEISINLVRQLKKFLTLRPCMGEYKIAIVKKAEKLNAYSQNALLKIFEEAPKHAIVILSAKTSDSILNTITSRAVKLSFWQTESESLPGQCVFENLFTSPSADRYNYIEKIGAQKALEFFKEWIAFLRTRFKNSPTKELVKLLTKNQSIYFKLNETNINPKFAYDELILSLWKP